MIGHRKETVSVGRKVYANYLGLLINHMIDEARVLMAEPVVVLSPNV
jgi:ABC-type taurine transport system ATPase subunit